MDTHNDTQHHSHQKKFLTRASTTITIINTNDHSTMHTTIHNDALGGSVNAPQRCTHQSPLYIYIYICILLLPQVPSPPSSTINHCHQHSSTINHRHTITTH